MHHVIDATYANDHKIIVRFENGERKLVDLAPHLDGPILAPLRDVAYFRSFTLNRDIDTLTWPDQYVKSWHKQHLTPDSPLVRMTFLEQTEELRKAMSKFGEPKAVWITEIWSDLHIDIGWGNLKRGRLGRAELEGGGPPGCVTPMLKRSSARYINGLRYCDAVI